MKNTKIEFDILKSNKLYLLCGIVCVVVLLVTVIVSNTLAKYRVTDTVPIINSEINYKVPDLNIVSLYVANEEGAYVEADVIPTSGYTLNTEQSYCGRSNNGEIVRDDTVSIIYENGLVNVNGLSKKGTKCYLYFDVEEIQTAGEQILANYSNQLIRSDFSTTVTNTTTGTIYYADTSDGRTYYFAGNPTDNWVQFAGFYWRIIRINEDGSIRMIYAGTDPEITTGTGTQIQTSAFNYTYGDNTYVGYMMGLDNECTSGSCVGTSNTTSYSQSVSNSYDSTIKTVLDEWYENNLRANYAQYLSTEAGFCGDRTYTTGNGYGETQTYYGARDRLYTNKTPSFECTNTADLYTVSSASNGNRDLNYPIGLISVDEAAYAGGVNGTSNSSYYLYTNQNYWTMSPSYFSVNSAYVSYVYSTGILYAGLNVYGTSGVRPVINLSPDVTITGDGTVNSPYQVVGA